MIASPWRPLEQALLSSKCERVRQRLGFVALLISLADSSTNLTLKVFSFNTRLRLTLGIRDGSPSDHTQVSRI